MYYNIWYYIKYILYYIYIYIILYMYSYGHLSVISTKKTPFIECILSHRNNQL